ncbi:tRNA (adenosine(37)-N6)-dimethylallyltransferase MiaA [Heliobacterium mobile]|uniref:tRNA (adenosine(37)-N6)-dimethylallyltransferase MiaA n=1 Tax=Heliobacterium mobile TaxID=28064 RepID=UPI002E2730A0|nr:tRNA (adenosine(37)-N6)-dimethylallyltransferase MiaA [Heliobacterium mobile]
MDKPPSHLPENVLSEAALSEALLPLVLVVGPTAVGKSDIGIAIAQHFNGEIISGDSMQVYRGMDIGSAKIPPEQRGGIPHHMIDIIDPDEPFSVADFQRRVTDLIPQIVARGRLPIMVGGTGLYVRSITDHYKFSEEAKDLELRARLETKAAELGPEAFHRLLAEIDPDAAKRIHFNDRKRIIRAMEVYHLTGKRQGEFHYAASVQKPKYRLAPIALTMDRQELYRRIDQRAQIMIELGLVEEVKGLLERGYDPALPSMQGLGYKEIVNYLRGEYNLSHALYLIQRDTRHFAKRQYTWFRRDPRLNWFAVDVMERDFLLENIYDSIRKALGGHIENINFGGSLQ